MSLDPVLAALTSRFSRVRTGLAVGFDGEGAMNEFKARCGGVWAAASGTEELPFEDRQFEVVVLERRSVDRDCVHEAHRVLKPDGCLFFTVPERTGKQEGFTPPEIYKVVREGFDIIELKRPKWWTFGRCGHTITVCARKKAWREHRGLFTEGSLPFTPFRERT